MLFLEGKRLLFWLALFCPFVLAAPAGDLRVRSSPDFTPQLFHRRGLDATKVDKTNLYDPDFDPFAPRPSATSLQPDVPFTDPNPDNVLWTPSVYKGIVTESKDSDLSPAADTDVRPEPVRGNSGAIILGPKNSPMELQNADALAPPYTDNGKVSNFKWPFSLSHNQLNKGGWARQQNGEFKKMITFSTMIYLQSTICLLPRTLLVCIIFLVRRANTEELLKV